MWKRILDAASSCTRKTTRILYVEVRGVAEVENEGARELIDRLCQEYTGNDRYIANDGTDNARIILRIHPEKVVTLIR